MPGTGRPYLTLKHGTFGVQLLASRNPGAQLLDHPLVVIVC
jgi:hypothetical protein